jgi:hypothetical protein
MTLILNDQGTIPARLEVKVLPLADQAPGGTVRIGEYVLSMKDFCALAAYALANTNLEDDEDPRIEFVKQVQTAQIVEGFPTYMDGERINPTHRRYRLERVFSPFG